MEDFVGNQITLNTYDIFANLIPGLTFFIGIWLPFATIDHPLPSIDVAGATVILVIAFIIGVGFQALGSYAALRRPGDRPSKPFNRLMGKIRRHGIEGESSTKIDAMELQFYNECQSTFKFEDEFHDWSRLFKAVLSYLESSPLNRGLRMQMLHLLSRGVFVAFCFLFLLYLIAGIVSINGGPWGVPQGHLVYGVLAVLSLLLAIVFRWRALHFEHDIVDYVMAEFILAREVARENPEDPS